MGRSVRRPLGAEQIDHNDVIDEERARDPRTCWTSGMITMRQMR